MIVVTGADGQLGTAFRNVLPEGSIFLNRSDLDLENLGDIAPIIGGLEPSALINCAAYTAVDLAETEEEIATIINGLAVREMAKVCGEMGVRFVTLSTDYVFDGSKEAPYVESDIPCPLNAYGRSKALGEKLALEANPDSLIIRTSWLLSGTHPNFITAILDRVRQGGVSVVADQLGSPTFVNDLAPSIHVLLGESASGILHLANAGVCTWYELAREVTRLAAMDPDMVEACTSDEYPSDALRPLNSVLSSDRLEDIGIDPLPHYRDSLRPAVLQFAI